MHTGCSERPLETRLSGCLSLGTSPGPPCMLGPPLRSTPCRVCSRGTDCPARPSTGRVSVTAAGGGRRCRAGAAPGVRGVPVLMETSTGARGGEQPGGPHGVAHAELRAQRGSGWAWALCPLPPRQPPLGRSCCSGRRGACQGWDPRLLGTCWGRRRLSCPCSRPVGLGSFSFSHEQVWETLVTHAGPSRTRGRGHRSRALSPLMRGHAVTVGDEACRPWAAIW